MSAAVKSLCAVVTGGASGLGKAVTKNLVKSGYKVAILDIPQSAGVSVAAEFSKEYEDGKAFFVPADVSNDKQLKTAFEEIKAKLGHLNALVNCAGISFAFKMYNTKINEPCELDKIQRTMDVNVVGTLNCIRYSVPLFMINEKDENGTRGVIVNTASIAAFDGQTGQAAYAASKGAISSMTLPLARDFAQGHGPGIRVMAIAPGLFNTPLLQSLPPKAVKFLENIVPHPKRFGMPEEFACLVQHCIDNPYLNGEVIRLDGAIRMSA